MVVGNHVGYTLKCRFLNQCNHLGDYFDDYNFDFAASNLLRMIKNTASIRTSLPKLDTILCYTDRSRGSFLGHIRLGDYLYPDNFGHADDYHHCNVQNTLSTGSSWSIPDKFVSYMIDSLLAHQNRTHLGDLQNSHNHALDFEYHGHNAPNRTTSYSIRTNLGMV